MEPLEPWSSPIPLCIEAPGSSPRYVVKSASTPLREVCHVALAPPWLTVGAMLSLSNGELPLHIHATAGPPMRGALLAQSICQRQALLGCVSCTLPDELNLFETTRDPAVGRRLRVLAMQEVGRGRLVPVRIVATGAALSRPHSPRRLHILQRPVSRGATLGAALHAHLGDEGLAALRSGKLRCAVDGLTLLPLDGGEEASVMDVYAALSGPDGWLVLVLSVVEG